MRAALRHLKASDPVLAQIIARVGPCRIDYRPADFAAMARAILYQQLHGKAAAAIHARLIESLGVRRLTPAALLQAPTRQLRAAGLSGQKAAYLQDLASRTASGKLRFRRLARLPDEQVIAVLTEVKGIGLWSAQMFLLFALRRPDVLASGDYGIRAAVQQAYGLRGLPAPAEVERIGRPWRPYASVACWYLWRSRDAL